MITTSNSSTYTYHFNLSALCSVPMIIDSSDPRAGSLRATPAGSLEFFDGVRYQPFTVTVMLDSPKIFQDMVNDYIARSSVNYREEEIISKYPEAKKAREIYDDIIKQCAALEIIKNG